MKPRAWAVSRVSGGARLFDELVPVVTWKSPRVHMYDRVLDQPRLSGSMPDERPAVIEHMRKLSARVPEGHPSPWLLFPGGKDAAAAPKLLDKGKGHWVLFWKQDVTVSDKTTTLGFGLTNTTISSVNNFVAFFGQANSASDPSTIYASDIAP